MVEDPDIITEQTALLRALGNIYVAISNLSHGIIRKDQPTSFYTEIAGINSALQKMSARPPPPSVYD
jgi:hypothetical protein